MLHSVDEMEQQVDVLHGHKLELDHIFFFFLYSNLKNLNNNLYILTKQHHPGLQMQLNLLLTALRQFHMEVFWEYDNHLQNQKNVREYDLILVDSQNLGLVILVILPFPNIILIYLLLALYD